MMEQSKAHFEQAQHFVSFELIDPELFLQFKESLPQKQLDIAIKHSPLICKEKLKVLYTGAEFAGLHSAVSLLRMLKENKLQDTFSEMPK